jgi:hypothetical protein
VSAAVHRDRDRGSFVGASMLTACLALPSLYVIQKYLGALAILPYFVFVAGAVWLWRSGRMDGLGKAIGERRARWLALATFVGLAVLFAVGYPLANSGRFGAGSDADEALNQAARALLHGHFPYYERTYLGQPITPMPGELLLAMPFLALGNTAYQSLFWLGAGAVALWKCWDRDTARTWLFCVLVLLTCPAVLHLFVVGADYAANTLMVLVLSLALVTSAARHTRKLALCGLAALLGIAISSRANFGFVFPLVASRLLQTHRRSTAVLLVAVAIVAACAVTLPFLAFDPAHFSPLHTRTKLTTLGGVLPHADLVLPAIAFALTIALAARRWNGDTAAFLRNAGLVQALLVLSTVGLSFAAGRATPLANTIFGQFFLFFGIGAFAVSSANARSSRSG